MQNVVKVMGSKKPLLSNWVLRIGALLFVQHLGLSKDLRREIACYSDLLSLDCATNSTVLAIHEAYFSTELIDNTTTCSQKSPTDDEVTTSDDVTTEPYNYTTCYEDIRNNINKRCSGLNSCNYTYSEETERNCLSGIGSVFIRYDCVKEESINKYCNAKIPVREGYISSPGYPKYYPKLDTCSWFLEAAPGQTIFLKILHLQIRAAVEVGPTISDVDDLYAAAIIGQLTEQVKRCDDDVLIIMEGNVKRVIACGEDGNSLKELEVEAAKGIEINFHSVDFLPASGFLMYYKVKGCPTMATTQGTYLVERNGSAALFACPQDYVFNDTLENTRFMHCVRDHHWNDTLPPCTSLEDIVTTTIANNSPNNTHKENDSEIFTTPQVKLVSANVHKEAAYMEDILIPSILISVLFVGNTIIVIIIFCLRRKQRAIIKSEAITLDQKSQSFVEPNEV